MENSPIKGYLCVVVAAILWASSGSAGKALFRGGITPFDVVQVRLTVSALLLAFIFSLRFRNLFRIRKIDIGYFFVIGGLAMCLVQITYFYAISKIQVAAAIFLQYLSPVMVAFFSICFWRERLSAAKVFSLVLSIAGCYLIAGGYNLELLKMNRAGILSGMCSALCFATYTLSAERGMHRYSPWTVLFYSLLFAAFSMNIFYQPFRYLWAGYTFIEWVWLIYISVMGTLIPFGLFFVGVNHIRSTRATITASLEPISAGFIAYLFLGEVLESLQILGGALVVGAIVLLQFRQEQDELAPVLVRARKFDSDKG